ncbi:hypothetical protein IMK15_06260, partial [Sneathia sp. DSM 16631]
SNGAEVSLTSKTTFPFEKKDGEYGKAASSEHTLKLGAKKLNNFEDLEASLTIGHVYAKDGFRKAELKTKGTYVGLKDTKLNGEFNFIDEKEDDGKTDKNMAVSLKAGANYKGVKDLELDGKFNFKYQVKGTSKVKDIITDSDIVLNKDAYAHSYELDAKYTGVKDLELTAGAFVQHIHFDNGSLENYISNPFEYLYAQSIMSGDKDFLANAQKEAKEQRKAYDEAVKALKDLEANEAKMKAYNLALENYNKAYGLKVEALKKAVDDAQKDVNEIAVQVQKDVAQKAHDKQAELNKLNAEKKALDKKKTALEGYKDSLTAKVKAEFVDTKDIDAEIEKLTKEIAAYGSETAEGKIKKAKDELDTIVDNGGAKAKGTTLANAEKDRDTFDKDAFKASPTKYKLEDGKVTAIDNNNGSTGQQLETTLTTDPVAGAKKALEDIKNKFPEELYKAAKKATAGLVSKVDLVNFGAKLGAKYTGVKNLTLTADGVFAGRYHSAYDKLFKYPAYTTGYVKLHAGAKYDFKLLNDKLVVSPEGNVTATFADIYAGICNPSLVLAPKVSVEYKPIEELKVKGSVEVPVRFGLNEFNEFGYKNTGIKGSLNMRYEWK